MKRGFTFGKYLPFHKGHQALIDFALGHCDELIVLICAGHSETIPGKVRSGWISQTYQMDERVRVVNFDYDESILPNTSVSSEEVSALWARQFATILPKVDVLFSSEPYGQYVSEYMGIQSVLFDPERKQFPVSASLIRNSVYKYWHFLPDPVKPYFQKKVVLLGTESTGKSTMARLISDTYNAALVTEIGRDIIPDSNDFTSDQLKIIARLHAQNVAEAASRLNPLVVMDTDIYITQSYARYKFGSFLQLDDGIYQQNKADLYLYLSKDIAYMQDGTRLNKKERDMLDESHRYTLAQYGIKYMVIEGSYTERESKVMQLINDLLYSL